RTSHLHEPCRHFVVAGLPGVAAGPLLLGLVPVWGGPVAGSLAADPLLAGAGHGRVAAVPTRHGAARDSGRRLAAAGFHLGPLRAVPAGRPAGGLWPALPGPPTNPAPRLELHLSGTPGSR